MAIPNLISNVGLAETNSIDSLIGGTKWGYPGRDSVVSLTYSFSNSNSYYPDKYSLYNEPLYSLGSLTSTQQNAARNALKAWSEIANIQFTEVADKNLGAQSNFGDLRFARTSSKGPDQVNTAWGYYPEASSSEAPLAIAGDVWFTYNSKYDTDSKGTYGYYTFLHEIGHTLGLKHPHEKDGSGVVAYLDTDTTAYSVMSYRAYVGQPIDGITQSFFPTTPMLYDIAAIQYIYGANMNARSGDTVYSWAPSQQILQTIWDGSGNDTIDWSNQITNATINLNAGSWSKLGPAYGTKWNSQTQNWDIWNTNTLAIAYNVTIENANGGAGSDNILGNEVSNILRGNAGNDSLYGFAGNDSLYGGADKDNLYGGLGNDYLDGGSGNDYLEGGKDNDTYSVDSFGDEVSEYANQGIDTVITALNYYSLPDNVENLVENNAVGYGNSLDNNITGNSLNNILYGLGGNDTLDGGKGNDTVYGGIGDDTYYVDSSGDVVFESANEGIDTIVSSIDYKLMSLTNFENLTLTGNAIQGSGNDRDNLINGNDKDNSLGGGGGKDMLFGGRGNDFLHGGFTGNDVLNGGDGNDELNGGTDHDLLFGNADNDTLDGYTGDDTLNGGTGNDGMIGGEGNDTYYVDSSLDWILEYSDQGYDSVNASVNYELGYSLEELTLSGAAIQGTGNTLDNKITGNYFGNILSGGVGNDSLYGGTGNDTLNGGTGNDILDGQTGSDRLIGYGGTAGEYDTLTGGADSDTFVLGNSTSIFYGGAGYAKITDWQAGVDKIEFHGSFGPFNNQFSLSKDYWLGTTSISFNSQIFVGDNLIAVVQSTDVNLSDFVFV